MNKRGLRIGLLALLIIFIIAFSNNIKADYSNNYPFNYEDYNDYEFSNEDIMIRLKYPKDWIVKDMKIRKGSEIQEADPELGGVEIYANANSERPVLWIYKNISHMPGVFDERFEQTGSIVADNEKIADIWTEEDTHSDINMTITYRDTYEGAIIYLDKKIFKKYEKEIYAILSSVIFQEGSVD